MFYFSVLTHFQEGFWKPTYQCCIRHFCRHWQWRRSIFSTTQGSHTIPICAIRHRTCWWYVVKLRPDIFVLHHQTWDHLIQHKKLLLFKKQLWLGKETSLMQEGGDSMPWSFRAPSNRRRERDQFIHSWLHIYQCLFGRELKSNIRTTWVFLVYFLHSLK
jgi:hypothetical protein